MISEKAIREYEAKPLRDSDRAKRFSDAQLDAKLRKLGAKFHTEPRRHQKVSFLLGVHYGAYLFFIDMSGGKTKLGLDLGRHLGRRTLVLVPAQVNLWAWMDQMEQHAPDLSGSPTTRADGMMSEHLDVVVCTYQGFAAAMSKTVKKPGEKNRWVPDHARIREVCSTFDTLILDESSALRNHRGLHFRVVCSAAKHIPYRFALTGTPFDKGIETKPEHVWCQFKAIDKGETLGETLGIFREVFYEASDGHWGGKEYKLRRGKIDDLHRRIRHRSIRYNEAECHDLPTAIGGIESEQGPMLVRCGWGVERQYYLSELEALRSLMKDTPGASAEISESYTRLRQMSSGWMKVDETVVRFEAQPKTDALLELLQEIPEQEKVIVVVHYHETGALVEERLVSQGHAIERLYGKTPNKQAALKRFAKGSQRILLASSTIAYGLNLQDAARRMIFYEGPDSGLIRQQIERRIRRTGAMSDRVYYYDLVMRGGVDEQIIQGHINGKDLLEAIIDGKEAL